jgi:hypothetical protein
VLKGLNSLAVVIRKPDATKKGFTNLHFDGAVVTDSPSQAIAIAQIEHSTIGGNPDGHIQ